MSKSVLNFTVDTEIADEFKKEINVGNRSEKIEELIQGYISSNNYDSLEARISEIDSKIEDSNSKIQKEKSKISSLKSEKISLENKLEKKKEKEKEMQKFKEFAVDQRDKFERFNGSFSEFREEYPGLYNLYNNKADGDLNETNFWSKLEKEFI